MHRAPTIFLAVVSIAALLACGAWYRASSMLHYSRAQIVRSTLQPVSVMLRENQGLMRALQTESLAESDPSILDFYLMKIRHDGVAKHADMTQRLDQIAENNTAIVALITAYAPYSESLAFTTEGDKFRNYSSAWRDRWNSVMELFMAGGNYAVAGVPFPAGFPAAVDAEIAMAK